MAMLHSFWVSPAAESPRRCGKFHHIDAHREVERARWAADWSQNTGLEG
jgi:hypothetical protein